MTEFINLMLLLFGFSYTFVLPGFVIVETFFYQLEELEKIPLILLLSVLISTYWIYFFSLFFGYSAQSILLSSIPFLIWFIFGHFRKKNSNQEANLLKEHLGAFFLSGILLLTFLLVLFPAIFSKHNNYYVMSAVNWQDTAMHLSIIETISQGNFPPQAPYFSGHPLNYYFFADFHSAILETLFGKFFPQILIYDNPIFIFLFSLSIYCLSFELFKNKLGAIFAAVLASLFGNLIIINFLKDLVNQTNNQSLWDGIISLLTNKGYTAEFGKLMQISPMADYFLQNRPVLVGLPAFVLVNLLIIKGLEKSDLKRILLAGLITGLLFKFQLFAFVSSIIVLFLGLAIFYHHNFYRNLKSVLLFLGPGVLIIGIFSLFFQTGQTLTQEFFDNLSFGPWDKNKDLFWYLSFYLTNFGLSFLSVLILFFSYSFFVIKKYQSDKVFNFLFGEFFILFAIPHLVRFTVYEFDMFKFFYFMVVPMSLLTSLFLTKLLKFRLVGFVLIVLILIISSSNSLLTLTWSFLNKYEGYSQAEYQAGLWIRNNTPQRSVFATYPSVHSAVSEIGGRLRVLSYIVWPYSHGFNKGNDNVFTRQSDLEGLYNNANEQTTLEQLSQKYKISYIYLGSEERNKYPVAESQFNLNNKLQLVYNTSAIKIYQIKP